MLSLAATALVSYTKIKSIIFLEHALKYLELIIAFACFILAALKANSDPSSLDAFIALLGGALTFIDSLRRFGFFGRVKTTAKGSKITPWSHTGGKVDKTDLSVEIFFENDSTKDIVVRSVEIIVPDGLEKIIGKACRDIRFLDIDNKNSEFYLPISIPSNASKLIHVECTYDASLVEKYAQAEFIGSLNPVELCNLHIRYSQGSSDKDAYIFQEIETLAFSSTVRLWYEGANDHKGVVKIIEKA